MLGFNRRRDATQAIDRATSIAEGFDPGAGWQIGAVGGALRNFVGRSGRRAELESPPAELTTRREQRQWRRERRREMRAQRSAIRRGP